VFTFLPVFLPQYHLFTFLPEKENTCYCDRNTG
jgi:hypothetical protein